MKLIHLIENTSQSEIDWAIKRIRMDCEQFISSVGNTPLYRGSETPFKFMDIKKVRMDRKPSATSRVITNLFDDMFESAAGFRPRTQAVFCTGDQDQAQSYGDLGLVFPIGDFKIFWSKHVFDFYVSFFGFRQNDKLSEIMFGKTIEILQKRDELAPFREIISTSPKAETLLFAYEHGEYARFMRTIMPHSPNAVSFITEDELIELFTWLFKTYPDLYTNKDLKAAIDSGNEIMVHCNEYYTIPFDSIPMTVSNFMQQLTEGY